MIHPIAIVGASTRAAAASAVRAGFQPITADLFADADLRRIATATRIEPYPDGFLDWLRAIEPPAWMYTGALENYPELVDQMAWLAPLWGNPGDVLAAVRSPLNLATVLQGAGLLFPETRDSAEGLPRDGTWLAKTYAGASGSGVRELNTEYGVLSTEHMSSPSAPCSVPHATFQRRIDGTSASAVFAAASGRASLLGATRQLIGVAWLGAHGFQYAGSVGPLDITDPALATISNIGNVLAARFELVGLFGVDFVLSGDDVWTLEVNPRYTASVEIAERISGMSAVKAHIEACRGAWSMEHGARSFADHSLSPSSVPTAHGKAIVFARRDVTISTEFAAWSLAESAREPWPTLADISPAGTTIEAGRPILTVFADGPTPEAVEERLRQRVAEIEEKVCFQSD